MSDTTFRPSLHGWPFASDIGAPTDSPGAGAPPIGAEGLAAGLCWAALDRFLADRRIERTLEPPPAGAPLRAELVGRQLDAVTPEILRRMREWQQHPDRDRPLGAAGLAARTRREWRRVRDLLGSGEPVLLCVIRGAGPYAEPGDNPLVLAYRYADDRASGRPTLWVYDPERPDQDDVRLTLDLRRRRPLDATLAGARGVRGFFAVPYDRARPARVAAESFADRSRVTMNHIVVEPPAAVAGRGGRLHLVARNGDGDLVHFEQRPDDYWEQQSLGQQKRVGAGYRAHGRPVALSRGPGGGLVVFARSYVGDLLAFRQSPGRGWSARNLTDQPRTGLRFRMAGDPVVVTGPGRRIDVFGRTREGHPVHYGSSRLRRWSAADLTEAPAGRAMPALRADPVAIVGPRGVRHLFGCTVEGELAYAHAAPGEDWVVESPTGRVSADARPRLAGQPVVLPIAEKAIDVFGRTDAGEFVHLHRSASGGWSARPLTAERDDDDGLRVASDPAAAIGSDGTIHLFARNAAGDLIHARRIPGTPWVIRNVTAGRPSIGEAYRVDGPPVAAPGPGATLYVAGRRGADLVLYTWRPDTDWVAENLTRERRALGDRFRFTADPVLLQARDGRVHVVGHDPGGCIIHLAIGGERPAGAARVATRSRRTKGRAPAAPPSASRPAAPGRRTAGPAPVRPASPAPATPQPTRPTGGGSAPPPELTAPPLPELDALPLPELGAEDEPVVDPAPVTASNAAPAPTGAPPVEIAPAVEGAPAVETARTLDAAPAEKPAPKPNPVPAAKPKPPAGPAPASGRPAPSRRPLAERPTIKGLPLLEDPTADEA